jgi:GNAT superfamily N-acetyltransferase
MQGIDDIILRIAQIEELLDLRWKILRAGLPRESANFDGDDEPTTHHFGAFLDDEAIGCATFLRRDFEGEQAWQLRGMAVSPDHQRSGIGARLLDFAERFILQKSHANLLWCNARVPASKFYEGHGWRIVSDKFDIPSAGPHVRMIKVILKG